MEINPKRIFQNEEINLPNVKKNKEKGEGKSAEIKSKAPNNPAYYSNYYGIHKVSFGQSQQEAFSKNLEFLEQLRDDSGDLVFEKEDLEAVKEEEENPLITLSKDENVFELFKTVALLKYDNGERVFNKEQIKQFADISASITKSDEDEFEMYGLKGHYKFNSDFEKFITQFINVKDKDGKYLFNNGNFIQTLLTMYMFKPENVSGEKMIKTFQDIDTINQNKGKKFTLEEIIELTIFKSLVKDWENFDIESNYDEIIKYCNKNNSGISEIYPSMAVKVLIEGGNTKKNFDKLMGYRRSNGSLFFYCENIFELAKIGKEDGKIFELLDKLFEAKDENGEILLSSSIIYNAVKNGETSFNNALKICSEKDKDKQHNLVNMLRIENVISDDTLFERANTLFEKLRVNGHYIGDPYSSYDIIKDENRYNTLIKHSSLFTEDLMPFIPILSNLSDKQYTQIEELVKLAKQDGEENKPYFYGIYKLVQDDETFNIAKRLMSLRDKNNKSVISSYEITNVFTKGIEFAQTYVQAAELLQSTGMEYNDDQIQELVKDEKVLKQAELFKGIKKENGEPILKFQDLISFAQKKPEEAERIAETFKLKNSDGKFIEIPYHYLKLITDASDEEFKNFIKYLPKFVELKDSSNKKVITDIQDAINCAKKGEKAYKHAQMLLTFKQANGTPVFNNYNIPKAAILDDNEWNLLIKATTEKNSLGENVFTKDSIIMSIVKSNEIDNKNSFIEKSSLLSELRNPKNNRNRLLSEEGIYSSIMTGKDFTEKYKSYAPKLLEIKNANGKEIINQENLHNYIIDNDMSLENLYGWINSFANFKDNQGKPVFFYDGSIINAINKGEEFCGKAFNLLTNIANKKIGTTKYVTATKINQLLNKNIEEIELFNNHLDKLDEFKDYPFENNICYIAENLASLNDEDFEKALSFARYKGKDSLPFFTYQEVEQLSIQPKQYRNNDIGVVQTFDEKAKANLGDIINSVCTLKEKMLSNPMLYVNGEFNSTEDAKRNINFFFSQNKGKLMLMTTIFDKETIDNIMRKRIAVSSNLLYKLHDFNEKEQKLLKQLINSTNKDGKPFMPAQKIQFVNLISAFKNNHTETDILERMLESGKVDIGEAELTLLKNILKKADLDVETIEKIPPERLIAWNNENLHLLITDMKNSKPMKDLFIASLTEDFNKYIHSQENEYGKVNNATKEKYKEAGLNYDAWLKPDDKLAIQYVSKDKNAEALSQIAKQIEEDIETLRNTPAKKYIDKQLSKYIKEDKFTVPTNIQTNKNLLKSFVNNTISQLDSVWERANKNSENPDLKEKARNTLTILDHLKQRIQDIEIIPDLNISKNLDLTIKMWERCPEKDIFQGNYSTCCIGIGNFNSAAMPHFVLDSAYNMIELTDNYTGNTIGNALCYFIKDEKGQPAFIIDNIEINNAVKPSENIGIEIRNKMAEYASKVAKEVTGRDDTPIYMSNNYNDVSTSDLKHETHEIEFIGDISAEQIYMDLYGGWTNKSDLKSTKNILRLK